MTSKDKVFYNTVFAITLPIALQNLISYGVNMMDTVMLGKLGEIALSAASLANQMFFIFNIGCMGIAGGAMVLVSQYWGRNDLLSIQKVTTITVKITFAVSVIFTLLIFIFSSQIMHIFTNEVPVITAGASYLRAVSISYLFFGVTATFLVILRSVETVKISVLIYSISFVVNVFFNYVFIFGKFGAPTLGVVGAAIGTVIARITEFIMMAVYILFYEEKIKYRLNMLKLKDKNLVKDIVHYGLPVMINELFWAVGISVHSVILGHMGSAVVAANSICNVIFQMVTSVILGVSNASAVVIGKVIGTNDFKYAKACAVKLLKMYFFIGLVSAITLIAIRKPIISIYDIEESTKILAENLMFAYAAAIFFMSYACPFIMGIFRGSGSTRFAMFTDLGCLWFAIPIGAAAAFIFDMPPLIVFACLKIDMPIKTAICFWYFKKDKWIKDVTRSY